MKEKRTATVDDLWEVISKIEECLPIDYMEDLDFRCHRWGDEHNSDMDKYKGKPVMTPLLRAREANVMWECVNKIYRLAHSSIASCCGEFKKPESAEEPINKK